MVKKMFYAKYHTGRQMLPTFWATVDLVTVSMRDRFRRPTFKMSQIDKE